MGSWGRNHAPNPQSADVSKAAGGIVQAPFTFPAIMGAGARQTGQGLGLTARLDSSPPLTVIVPTFLGFSKASFFIICNMGIKVSSLRGLL